MDFRCDRKSMNVEGDGLSKLPDDVIHKILSFVSIKHVVETSVLSSRWRYIWTSMPYLNFSNEDFISMPKFSKFVTSVLSRRDDQIEVASLKLSLHGRVSQAFVERVLNYAFSHNVQRMVITCPVEKKIRIPLSLFCSRSLKHLTLVGSVDHSISSTWELPALTTLHLGYVTLYDGGGDDDGCDDDDDDDDDGDGGGGGDYDKVDNIISKCPNLKNLTLDGCKIKGPNGFSICHPQLSNLRLENGEWGWEFVHVDAPQLKNLTIVNCDSVHLSAPDLASFIYRSEYSLEFSTDNLPSLEKVDLCIRNPRETSAHTIFGLLQQFHSVKSLTLNLETIEALSSSVELVSDKPSPFANLRSLKIYPVDIELKGQTQKKVFVSNEVKSYLLDGSPSASFTLVTREEIKARDATFAHHLMTELWVMLEEDKAKINRDHMRPGKAPTESHCDDLAMQSQLVKTKICDIISKLQHIEGLLTKLPTSNGSKLQVSFSSLCAEANLVIKKLDRTVIQFDGIFLELSAGTNHRHPFPPINGATRSNHSSHKSQPSLATELLIFLQEMGLKEEFEEHAAKAKTLPQTTTNEDLLVLYGLYKQATVGPVNTDRPGMFSMRERAKWDAWKAVESKTTDEAMNDYITKVKQLLEAAAASA
ncbi:hypothetical protein L1987_72248 [Smallanthus sonchifolius]|uniref:Uncharacterized protein n=1 Tax=Smallanthus sonchifolius TaxID=185202 RepID=A0ACB9AZ22_9ASTR|nr:hypothetical protein L1987_72248 [Smallanthus sonchifolius]